MQLFKTNTKIDFMGKRKLAMILSTSFILIAIISLIARGLSLGIDFTGGTIVEVGYQQSVELNSVRSALSEAGFPDATVQHFGTSKDVMVRLAPQENFENAVLSDRAFAAMNNLASGT
ncbi:MAG: protein translocase subunit SecF, partial [Sedimenticola sp.]